MEQGIEQGVSEQGIEQGASEQGIGQGASEQGKEQGSWKAKGNVLRAEGREARR